MPERLRSRKPFRKPLKRWQYTYSGWLRLIKCKNMTKEEEWAFHNRLWNDKEFAEKIYKEFEDWQAEEEEAELEEKAIRRKKKGRRYSGKHKGRGKFKEKDF